MAGCHDKDFDHTPGRQVRDALGEVVKKGDWIAHIAKTASRTRVSRRMILDIDRKKGTMTISPNEDDPFSTGKPGYNVKGANILRLCKCKN